METPPLQNQLARWLEEEKSSPWRGLNAPNADLQTHQPSYPRIEKELISFEWVESKKMFHAEIRETIWEDNTVQSDVHEGVGMGNEAGTEVGDQEHVEEGWERETEGDVDTETDQMLGAGTSHSMGLEEGVETETDLVLDAGTSHLVGFQKEVEGTSDMPSWDTSTKIQSASSDSRPGTSCEHGSGSGTESTRLDTKSRWAFLDESRREVVDPSDRSDPEDLPYPYQPELALDMMQSPEVPPSLMEQISIIGSQRPTTLSDDQALEDFLRKPRHEQRRSLGIFIDFLESQGPWFGVKRRVSQEKLAWNF